MSDQLNIPIPSDMTIVDNREEYKRKEFYLRLAMPPKARDLARLNRSERFKKGCKFQINLKINRAIKEKNNRLAKFLGLIEDVIK